MFDLRTWAPPAAAESQVAEGGANAADNCIPAAMAYAAVILGYPDVEPETWTEDEYHLPNPGPTTLQAAVDEAGRLYPGFPAVTQSGPDLAALESAGENGRLSIILASVDCASVVYGPGACGHAGLVVAHGAGGWEVWNPWTGAEDFVPDSTLAGAVYWQGVIDRDIRPAAPVLDSDPMPAEVPGPHFAAVGPFDAAHPLTLFNGFNTGLDRVYVRVRNDNPNPAGPVVVGTLVAVLDSGQPEASQPLSLGPSRSVEWQLPLGEVGDLILQSISGPVSVSLKFGRL